MSEVQWVARDFKPQSNGWWVSFIDKDIWPTPDSEGLLNVTSSVVIGWFVMENYAGQTELHERIRSVPAVWNGAMAVPLSSPRKVHLHSDKKQCTEWFSSMEIVIASRSQRGGPSPRYAVIDHEYPILDRTSD